MLVCAPYGQDGPGLEAMLTQEGFQAKAYPALAALAAALDEHVGAVLVTDEALPRGAQEMEDALARQPPWSDLPFVLLTARPSSASVDRGDPRSRLPLSARNVVLLERPLSRRSIVSAVDAALRGRGRQFELRRRLEELEAGREALRESEAELRRVTNALPILVGFIDSDQRYRFANQAYEDWCYTDPAQVVGRTVSDVLGDAYEARRPSLDRALAGEPVTLELAWPHQDGRRRDAEVRYLPRRNAAGEADGVHVFVVDVTDRNLRAEALEQTAAELEARVAARTADLNAELANRARTEEVLRQSQKMEAVGQLTGGVAHDFNNLLTIIRSAVDFLSRDGLPEARRKRYVQAISETAERAAKLTGQLLAFARRQPLKPERFDVGARIRSVTDLVRPLVGGRVRIELDLFPGEDAPSSVNADVSQFETALVNLAVNARDAMDGEGVLTFSARSAAMVPAIRGHAGAVGDFVAVSVSDTGAGVPADKVDVIFEPFYTTKEVGKGTGLGLSQVFGFVKQSGGEIEVENPPGSGARFTLYLPAVASEPAAAAVEGGRELPQAARLQILLVEDNQNVGRFTSDMLEDIGHGSVWVGSADRALAELRQDHQRFDVVFSDVIMPGMNGVALALKLRDLYPDLPVVLTSGYSEVLAAEGAHGFELLQKPYSVTGLTEVLRRAAAGR